MVMTIVFYIIFFLAAVMGAIADSSRWIVILIALVHPLIALPIAFFIFYKGYQGAVLGPGYFKFYKLGETLVISIGFVIFFLSLSGYHGPLFIVFELGNKKKSMPLVILAVLETIAFFIGIGIRVICLLKVQNEFDPPTAFD